MVKFKAPVTKEKLKRTSIRLPKAMVNKIDEDMVFLGFNKKQRSLWFSKVLTDFFEIEDYTHLVAEEFIVPGTTQPVAINIELDLLNKIDNAVSETKAIENEECDRSSVIRTAILQRLLKADGLQIIESGEIL